MIKINIDDKNRENAKNVFRKWFFYRKNNIYEFKEIIDKDDKLKSLIFENEEMYSRWVKLLEAKTTSVAEKKECHKMLESFFFAEFNDKKNISRYVVDGEGFKNETKKFFEKKYRNFRDSQGAKFVRELNIKVCPYCNRNYIELYNYTDKGVKKRIFKGELDHYYSQSKYPHLSLCLFNLIPCCKICNHEKLDKSLKIFNPYYDNEERIYRFKLLPLTEEDIRDITFEEKIDDLESKINDITYLQGISDNFKIVIEPIDYNYKDIMENSNQVFKLEKKYNNSKKYISELIRKKYIYSDAYADILSKNFNEIFKSANDVKRDIFSNELDANKHNERPLSKLTYDILRELNII